MELVFSNRNVFSDVYSIELSSLFIIARIYNQYAHIDNVKLRLQRFYTTLYKDYQECFTYTCFLNTELLNRIEELTYKFCQAQNEIYLRDPNFIPIVYNLNFTECRFRINAYFLLTYEPNDNYFRAMENISSMLNLLRTIILLV